MNKKKILFTILLSFALLLLVNIAKPFTMDCEHKPRYSYKLMIEDYSRFFAKTFLGARCEIGTEPITTQ